MGAEIKKSHRPLLITLLLILIAITVRGWDLGGSGIQNDEQIWHERSARFILSILGPMAPDGFVTPIVYWPIEHVDLLAGDTPVISTSYPFTIKMPASHPGTPMGFLIGLCYLLFGRDTGPWSMNLAPVIVVARYPAVALGTLWVVMLYLWGRKLLGERAAFLAALMMAVEPVMVGYSRLARIDLSGAVWATGAFFSFYMATHTKSTGMAILAGIFAALALDTNPYGLFLIGGLLAVRLAYGCSWDSARNFIKSALPRKTDLAFMASWGIFFILFYPNLWPNPIAGISRAVELLLSTPHATGEASSNMPISHWFYLVRSPQHVLPWVLALALTGIVVGLARRRRNALVLLAWGGTVILFLSIPPGRKSFKNFLLVMPSLLMLAGIGTDWLLSTAERALKGIWRYVPTGALACLILIGGLLTTADWWPYPQLYTWPWVPDPQTLPIREIVGTGEGIREAIEYIRIHGSPGDRIACFTGANNAAYYYDSDLVGSPTSVRWLEGFDWLIVLPKLTFCASDSNSLVAWVRSHTPTHVIYIHQIELVRIYRLEPTGQGDQATSGDAHGTLELRRLEAPPDVEPGLSEWRERR